MTDVVVGNWRIGRKKAAMARIQADHVCEILAEYLIHFGQIA